MASVSPLHVVVRTRVTVARNIVAEPEWHRDRDVRCRVASVIYRLSWRICRVADHIDHPDRHGEGVS